MFFPLYIDKFPNSPIIPFAPYPNDKLIHSGIFIILKIFDGEKENQ